MRMVIQRARPHLRLGSPRAVSSTRTLPKELWLKVLGPPSSGHMCRPALLPNLRRIATTTWTHRAQSRLATFLPFGWT